MENLIIFMQNHVDIIRPIWFALGIIGYFIFRKTRPDFYINKSAIWWIACLFAYCCLGPWIFILSIITIFVKPRIIKVKEYGSNSI